MTTALFVHGTGIRAKRYQLYFEAIQKGLGDVPGLSLEKCLWGDSEGTTPADVAAVIPDYEAAPQPQSANRIERALASNGFVGPLLAKNYTRDRWRAALNENSGFTGDVLLYAARGGGVRRYIQNRVEEVASAGPVVLLAHSLGGVASVDLMVEQALPQVKLLITFGAQPSYFYNINALPSLAKGEVLPEHFPDWINIYNPRDYLSYVCEKVFPGRVKDFEVTNRIPFPFSHHGYWYNPDFFQIILDNLKTRQLLP